MHLTGPLSALSERRQLKKSWRREQETCAGIEPAADRARSIQMIGWREDSACFGPIPEVSRTDENPAVGGEAFASPAATLKGRPTGYEHLSKVAVKWRRVVGGDVIR
jgi:hypothetical protein